MLLKSADDKSKRLALLEELQRSPLLDSGQKGWFRDELMRLKNGMQGERDSAHYLDSYFKDKEHVLLHDLRFVVDGDVAQIDHLIISRAGGIYLLETKNYSCTLDINEYGEFTAVYGNTRFGIESPIEQSLRHERVLSKLLEKLEIGGRTHKQIEFQHVVMLHPKAIIKRPPAQLFDTRNVIKADQFPTWHEKYVQSIGVGAMFIKIGLNLRSMETIKDWGEKLMRQHRPANLLALPEFMRPQEPKIATTSTASMSVPASGGSAVPAKSAQVKELASAPVAKPAEEPAKRLICAHCGSKISFAEGKFCWNNVKRFGGVAYCREHQALLPSTSR